MPVLARVLCAAIGTLNLLSALTDADAARLHALTEVVPGAAPHLAAAGTAAAGVLLLLLAQALRRRKRRAWRAVVGLLSASVVLHVVKGLDVEEAAVAAALLIALLRYGDEFHAKGDPRTRWRALGVFAVLAAISLVLGLVLVLGRAGDIVGPHPFGSELVEVLDGLVGLTGPLRFSRDGTAELVAFTLPALGLLTLLTPLYLALRPPEPPALLAAGDEERIRALLARHGGRDSLGYFALRRDKGVLWSPTGKSCISYRVVSGVLLAGGDPLGDPEAWPPVIERFLALAAEHAWVPAVMGCSERAATVYSRAGLAAWEIGDEAVVEVAGFSLDGRARRNVRQAVARAERAGYSCVVRRIGDMSNRERAELRAQLTAWRGTQTERGFSMALGRIGDPADTSCVAVLGYSDGALRGFLHFVPWGDDGLSLDVMVRDRDADNGLNEYLIVSALRAAPALGVRRLSLNFAVFRAALERGGQLGAGPVLRAWRGVLLVASRWFQIESLYRFNAKFQPIWERRFVCYPTARDLPRVAVAALEAEAFLVWPLRPLRPLRRLRGLPSGTGPPN